MGLFTSKETDDKRARVKEMRGLIKKQGLASQFNEQDYTKVLIEQNDAIFSILTQVALNTGGVIMDAFALNTQSSHYENLEKIKGGK